MKKSISIILIILTALASYGQDITGQWNGVLKVQGIQLRVVFHIDELENVYSSTMDSPDQGAKGIPVTSTSFENSILKLTNFVQNNMEGNFCETIWSIWGSSYRTVLRSLA